LEEVGATGAVSPPLQVLEEVVTTGVVQQANINNVVSYLSLMHKLKFTYEEFILSFVLYREKMVVGEEASFVI
jgi:hypothetical protein